MEAHGGEEWGSNPWQEQGLNAAFRCEKDGTILLYRNVLEINLGTKK